MKKIIAVFFILLSLSSCREEDFDKNNPPVPSAVSGTVMDPTVGKPIPHFVLTLNRSWYQYRGHGIGRNLHIEKVAEITTDQNGNYHHDFGYIPATDGRTDYHYYLEYDPSYRPDFLAFKEIRAGENTVTDFGMWKPVKYSYTINVRNSKNPPFIFRVSSPAYTFLYDFGHSSFYLESGTIKDFLFIRPNSDCVIHFQYYTTDAAGNPVLHEKKEALRTHTEETMTNEFDVDCSTF